MSTEITAEVRAEWRAEAEADGDTDYGTSNAARILALLDALDAEERVGQEHVESLAEDCEEQRIRAERAEAALARVEALVPVFEAKYGIQSSPVSLLTAALAGPSPTDEPRKRWLSDREYVIDNATEAERVRGGEGGAAEGLAELIDREIDGTIVTRSEHHPACQGDCRDCPIPVQDYGDTKDLARAILAAGYLSPDQAAAQIAAAEQRGREDSANHGMCYVAGSEALAARERQAGAAVLLGFVQWVASNRAYNGSEYRHGQSLYNEALNSVLHVWATDYLRAERLEAGDE